MSAARHTRADVGPAPPGREVLHGPRLARVALALRDEPDVLAAISDAFRDAGFEVAVAASRASVLRRVHDAEFDLVVLDVTLPDASWIDLLREVRESGDVPVILLGSGYSEAERILGLELGADDYVTKPSSPLELASRGRAILRRTRRQQQAVAAVRDVGSLPIRLPRHEGMGGGRSVRSTPSG